MKIPPWLKTRVQYPAAAAPGFDLAQAQFDFP
jgi:hypothetical protein